MFDMIHSKNMLIFREIMGEPTKVLLLGDMTI